MCTVGDPGWRHGSHETACITGPRREVKKTESGREQQPSEVWAFFPGHKFKKSDWWPYLPAPEHLHPSPKAVMATVERLQRGWEHLKPVPRESCPGLSRLWQGDVRKMSRLPDHCRVSPRLACSSSPSLACHCHPSSCAGHLPLLKNDPLYWRPSLWFWVVGLPALLTRN